MKYFISALMIGVISISSVCPTAYAARPSADLVQLYRNLNDDFRREFPDNYIDLDVGAFREWDDPSGGIHFQELYNGIQSVKNSPIAFEKSEEFKEFKRILKDYLQQKRELIAESAQYAPSIQGDNSVRMFCLGVILMMLAGFTCEAGPGDPTGRACQGERSLGAFFLSITSGVAMDFVTYLVKFVIYSSDTTFSGQIVSKNAELDRFIDDTAVERKWNFPGFRNVISYLELVLERKFHRKQKRALAEKQLAEKQLLEERKRMGH